MLTERRRKWQRDRRAKAAARGRCSTCGIHWPEFPNKTCQACLEIRSRAWAKAHPKEQP